MPRVAVIDLGTNTFHLLIAERPESGGAWQHLLRRKFYVKLAEEGIERIGDGAYERAMTAVRAFHQDLEAHQVPPNAVKAFGTAALRTAANAPDLLAQMLQETGIQPETISGQREAELIYKGVRQAVPFPEHRALIMDIGGGSVEFILADRQQVLWQQSFPVGVAVLYRNFQQHDPMPPIEVWRLENYLEGALSDLWEALRHYPAASLIGASGTFDVIDNLLLDSTVKPPLYGRIPLKAFEPLYHTIIDSTLEQRLAMPGIPQERAEMVVVAMVLLRHVLRKSQVTDIYTSVYALKEGMLEEVQG